MVGFNYRRVPAVALARRLVEQGRIGEIRHVRAQYLQDWIVDPEFPLVWRLQKERAGSGALGDIGAHIVDMAQFVTGDRLAGVSALTETFIRERPLPRRRRAGCRRVRDAPSSGPVTVDDAALFLGRFAGGRGGDVRGHPVRHRPQERAAARDQRSRGSLAFDLEQMNELQFYDGTEDPRRRRVPPHPGHRARPTPTPARGGRPATCSATSTRSPTRSSTSCATSPRAATRCRRSPTGCRCSWCWTRRAVGGRRQQLAATVAEELDGATDHLVHRPVGRPAVRGGRRLAAEWGYDGLEIACWGDHFDVGSARGRRVRRAAAARSWTSTAWRSTRSPTTSPGRRSATTRSTSGTRASCRRGSGATASPRACGSARPRR